MSSTWGEKIRISIFGGSHTRAIGVNIEGLPAGEPICWEQVLGQMARRAPGQDPTATTRKEADTPQVLCGLLDGVTTGAPLCAIIENTNQRSKDYSSLRVLPRPGHADYTAYVKYGNHHDVRGGGHFSGRLTAPLVFAGAIARQLLQRRGILVASHVASIGEAQDQPFDPVSIPPQLLERLAGEYFPVIDAAAKERMRQVVEAARLDCDSVGGVVECFGIPAMKGIEFGAGFDAARRRGSQNNDPFYYDAQGQVKTRTNHAGGILGGITNGMPLVFRAAFKPTPSIAQEQDTVNLETGQNATLSIHGRHDPCIVPRAVPCVEAAAAIAVYDAYLSRKREMR